MENIIQRIWGNFEKKKKKLMKKIFFFVFYNKEYFEKEAWSWT